MLRELSDLNDQLEAKKLEVERFSRQITELRGLLEFQSAKEEALNIVEELEWRFGDEGHLAQLNKQLEVAQEEAQLRLSQLHHVQEELEHYYLLSRKQSTMLDASTKLQERAAVLLAGFRV